MVAAPSRDALARLGWRGFWITVAVAPLLLPLLHHFLASHEATGFLMYDCPYYVANGRAIFERGNGFLYPNPYDPSLSAPVIYFHWLVWMLGYPVAILGWDPGYWFAACTVIAAWLAGWATLRLVETVLPEPRGRVPLFLLTMWGGGLLCVAGMIRSMAAGGRSLTDWFVFDPANGWWFPNWGRNLMLPTEAVYHALVAFLYIGVLRERWTLALGAMIALAATHPFSGAQHLLILGTWCIAASLWEVGRARRWEWLRRLAAESAAGCRSHGEPGAAEARGPGLRTAAWRVAVVALTAAAFAAYYFGYLNRFPQHRYLTSVWANEWTLDWTFLAFASGPVVALAIWRCAADRFRIGPSEWFLVVAGLVTFALMKHDLILPTHQPAHFSRGYNWLPWWLFALPLLQRWLLAAWTRRREAWPMLLGGAVAGLFVFDNAAFVAREWRHGEDTAYRLSPGAREMFRWIDRKKLSGVLVSDDAQLGYLSATYTRARPFLGHFANTPAFKRRLSALRGFFVDGTTGPWLDTVDYVLVEHDRSQWHFSLPGWATLHENGEYVLLGRNAETAVRG